LTRDHKLDGVLDPSEEKDEVNLAMQLNSHHNKFSGKYTKPSNDSFFTGETYSARDSTMIVFFQYDKKFYAIHTGHKLAHNHYAGTWFGSGNLSGDFELKKQCFHTPVY